MAIYFFWDIENVSIHNLEKIMDCVQKVQSDTKRYVVYSKIKEARKKALQKTGWILIKTDGIYRNSADKKIKQMIEVILEDKKNSAGKIIIISEDKGFYKISKKILTMGKQVEIICGTKYPNWVKSIKILQNMKSI